MKYEFEGSSSLKGTATRDYEYENSMHCLFAPGLNLQRGRSANKPRRFEIFCLKTVGRTALLEMKGAKMRRGRGRLLRVYPGEVDGSRRFVRFEGGYKRGSRGQSV